MLLHIVLLLLGTIAASTSILFIKAATVPPAYLGALRLLAASMLFLIPALRSYRRYREGGGQPGLVRSAVLPGVLLGIHFISWNLGARLTVAANGSLLVNMVPLVMPVLVYLLYKITLKRREIVGTGVAVAGIVLLSAGSVRVDPEYLRGDLICILSMTLFAAYVALAKKSKNFPLISYLCAVYAVGGLVCFGAGLALEGPPQAGFLLPPNLWYVAGLVFGPTMIGHSLINRSMLHLPSQVVSIAQMTQFIWSGAMAFVLFQETPALEFYPAALFVVLGGVLSLSVHWRNRP